MVDRPGDGGRLVGEWSVVRHRGRAQELHEIEIPDDPSPGVWVLEATRPAVVFGSTQEPLLGSDLDVSAIDVAQRRSGGGAVLVVPDGCTWIDIVLPSSHRLWDADVGRASHWVGDVWVEALASLGVDSFTHRGPMRTSEWSRLICFAGLGPGEVVDAHGRKIVGLSQRRTRRAARFQTVVYHGATASDVAGLLALSSDDASAARAQVQASTRSLTCDHDALVDAFLSALP